MLKPCYFKKIFINIREQKNNEDTCVYRIAGRSLLYIADSGPYAAVGLGCGFDTACTGVRIAGSREKIRAANRRAGLAPASGWPNGVYTQMAGSYCSLRLIDLLLGILVSGISASFRSL